MKSIFNRPPNSRALATALGQSSTEYLVICAALALALGLGMADDTSALRQLLDAFALSYQKISFAISLP